ncbi:PAS domain S-box protein [Methanococcoides sp. SA1]|nr:PAS domain S-box protein [Methanococcoides sp. SA1]
MCIVTGNFGEGLLSSSRTSEKGDLSEGSELELLCLSFDFIDGKISFEQVAQLIVEKIPLIFIHPDNVCACMDIQDSFYTSSNFKRTNHSLNYNVSLDNESIGVISVYNLDELAGPDSQSFSKKEEEMFIKVANHVEMLLMQRNMHTSSFEKEQSCRFLIENIRDVVYSMDVDMNLLYISPQVHFCGYTPEQVSSGNWLDLVHPDDRERLIDSYRATIKNELNGPTLFRVFDSEGRIHWMEEMGMPVVNSSGEVMGINGILRDVTERNNLEAALKKRVKFENIISDISSSFINFSSDELDGKIHDAMESIGNISDITQCHIYDYSSGSSLFSILYGWGKDGKEPLESMGDLPISKVPEFFKYLMSGKNIVVPSLDELPFDMGVEIDRIDNFHVRSFVVVPMIVKNKLIGFIDFNSREKEVQWSDLEVDMFAFVGMIIGNALQHERYNNVLCDNEMYFRSLFEESNDAVLIHGQDGTILNINKKACDMLGYDRNALYNINAYSLYDEDLYDGLPAFARKVISANSAHSEAGMIRADGSIIDVSISSSFVDRSKGVIQSIVRDITSKKEAEQELRSYRLKLEDKVKERTEELTHANKKLEEEIFERNLIEVLMGENELLLRNVLESSGDGIVFFDMGNKINLMNSQFRNMWEIPIDVVADMDYIDIFTEFGFQHLENAESVLSKVRKFSSRKEIDSGLLYFKDGRVIEYNLFPVIKSGVAQGHVCNCRDITINKKAEAELKDLFADILRHDLLNPVGIVKGFLSVLIQKENDPKMLDMLRKAEMSNQKVIDTIEMASKLSKLDSVEEIEFSVIDIGLMINIAKMNLGAMFENKNMRALCRFSGNYPAKANIMIEEVFVNLLSNAIKYSPKGSTVYIDILDVGDEWKVQFTDFGEGISDEEKGFIFERFKRVNKTDIKGTGIGLAIVRKIVVLHGGHFGVEDNPDGDGCVFWITLKKG